MSDLALKIPAAAVGPVYQRIAQAIRDAIAEGGLVAGERLPAIRRLAEDMAVNRDTVALAYEALASEGVVESTVGRGTFVRRTSKPTRDEPMPLALATQVERLLAHGHARAPVNVTEGSVPLHSLIPDPALYPVDDFRRAFNRVVAREGAELFVYGEPQGHLRLREVLAARFAELGMGVSASEMVLCHGTSQGIALALRLFANPGDLVAVEEPTYHNVLTTLAGLGIEPAVVPMTDAGPDLKILDRVLARPEVRALYTIPSFHNPMGTTTDAAHRWALLDIARRHGKPVIEDAFEIDLRCFGRPVAPLASMDSEGLVVHLFSFSKALFPGARVGSISVRGRALDGLVALKQATDLSDSLPLQAAMAEFVEVGDYDRHLRRIRRELQIRHRALQQALDDHMPEGTRWTRPEGGYQIWLELPWKIDTRELVAEAARAGVSFSPGSQFLPDGGPSRCLRLTLARTGEDDIRRGVEALGGVLRDRVGTTTAAGRESAIHM